MSLENQARHRGLAGSRDNCPGIRDQSLREQICNRKSPLIMRRPDVSISDGMINAVLNVVVHASDADRASAMHWAERRLARSSLSHDAAAELLDGLRSRPARTAVDMWR